MLNNKADILGGKKSVKVAIPQFPPFWMNLQKSVDRACELILEAGREGAELVVFAETWLSGYPFWSEGWDSNLDQWAAARLVWFENSLRVSSEETEALLEAARTANTHVVMGCNERDERPGTATVYNTQLFIGRDGKLFGKHRKLIPTGMERMFHGRGDSRDVAVYETDIGRIGGLICSENTMTAVRAVMIAMGEDIHISSWPGNFAVHTGPRVHEADTDGLFWGHAVSRCHAVEASAFVIEPVGIMDEAHMPSDFPLADRLNISFAQGDSEIIGPLGVPISGPVKGQQMIYATLESDALKVKRGMVDAVGHYSRPDVVQIILKRFGGETLTIESESSQQEFRVERGRLNAIADRYEIDEAVLSRALEDLGIDS